MRRRRSIALVIATAATSLASADVRYVDAGASAGGDGTSWASAFTDLQDGIDAAAPDDQVWVAEGTYHPDRGTGWRHLSFELRGDVAIYGGFVGTETTLEERDPALHVTVLSGDLANNDAQGLIAENSYHVVSALGVMSPATLDGFVIRGGNANGTAWFSRGGGLACMFADIVVIDTTFENSTASTTGGGIAITGGAPQFVGCTLKGLTAAQGAALSCSGADVSLVDVRFLTNGGTTTNGGALQATNSFIEMTGGEFTGNIAVHRGGGVDLLYSSATLTGVSFTSNRLTETGAAPVGLALSAAMTGQSIHITDCTVSLSTRLSTSGTSATFNITTNESVLVSPTTIEGTTFETNDGHGVYVHGNNTSPVTITSCGFTSNIGRGLIVEGAVAAVVEDSTFENNQKSASDAIDSGGAYCQGTGSILGCTFIENKSWAGAGALVFGTWTVRECTFAGNFTPTQGGEATGGGLRGKFGPTGSSCLVEDCLFEDNFAGSGGGIGCEIGATVRNCTFTGNVAAFSGGAAVLTGEAFVSACDFIGNAAHKGAAMTRTAAAGAATRIDSCRFLGNHAITTEGDAGSTIVLRGTAPVLTNLLVAGNTGEFGGAGLRIEDSSTNATIHCSTFANNNAPGNGDAIYAIAATVSVSNSIVWGNGTGTQANQLFAASGGFITVASNCVQGWTGSLGGPGNFGLNPLFVNALGPDGIAGTLDDDLHLTSASPCRDSGNAALLPADALDLDIDGNVLEALPVDLDGGARVIGVMDRGAFELASRDHRAPAGKIAMPIWSAARRNVQLR